MLVMANNDPAVKVLLSIVHYAAEGREYRMWEGRWMGALGDRDKGGGDPPYVCLKASYFE